MTGSIRVNEGTNATFNWKASVAGTSPIASYTIVCNSAAGYPASTAAQTFANATVCGATDCTTGNAQKFGGLSPGTPYSCTVKATDTAGVSSANSAPLSLV